MNLKIHPKKIATIILIFVFFGSGLFVIYTQDTLRPTRAQLENFYKTQLDSCFIVGLEKRKYPSRGNYLVFKTDCSDKYYPLIGSTVDSTLFTKYPIVIKDSASLSLILLKEGNTYQWTMKSPADEDDRVFGTKVILCFSSILIIITLVLPNSFFERKRLFEH